jgi:tetratricopeptide (TPR) repeat protein
MSRFSSLEFEDSESHNSQNETYSESVSGDVLSEEADCLRAADLAWREMRFENGLRYYAKALEFNANNPDPWVGQSRMLMELGEIREAKVWADKALERFPNQPELLAVKAVALARIGDLKEAQAYSDASFEEKGESPYIWIARGEVALACRQQRAEFCFDRALSQSNGDWIYSWLISRAYYFYEKFAKALVHAQQAVAIASDQGAVWAQLAFCQHSLGMTSLSFESMETALELTPREAGLRDLFQELESVSFFGGLWRRWTGWKNR